MAVAPAIVRCFADVPDPRIDRTKKHALPDILLITLCAVIVGAESWDTVATFGKSKQDCTRPANHVRYANLLRY